MTTNLQLSPVLAAEILKRDQIRRMRDFAISGTVNFAKFTGDNPWDFETQKPFYDAELGFYPWLPYAERQCAYLDAPGKDIFSGKIAKPIKPVFIGRSHYKTTFVAEHMAEDALTHPNGLYGVIADTDPKASLRLRNISEIYLRDHVNEAFADVLYSNEDQVKLHYTSSEIRMRRKRDAGQPTFTALGIMSKSAGYHFNRKCWFDDIVNEENYKNDELQYNLWMKLQQFIRYVCDPGCEIIISGTRYAMSDCYDYIFSDDSPIKKDIAHGFDVMGCYELNADGREVPLNFLKFCWEPEDKHKSVWHMGVEFHPIRASLVEEKEATKPVSEWYSQMENNPTSTENAVFFAGDFKNFLPVKGISLGDWLSDPDHVKLYIDPERASGSLAPMGKLEVMLLGDLAYSTKAHNDFSVALIVGTDGRNNIYLMDGMRRKTDKDTLKDFFRAVFRYRRMYDITKPLGIEVHAKESSVTVAEMLAAEMGESKPIFHPLKLNSHKKKEERIEPLAPIIGEGKLYVCDSFPSEILAALVTEAVTFPIGKHDDVIDTLANILQVMTTRKPTKKRPKNASWRSKAPVGVRRYLC